jgi:hypothetical protein
MDLLSRVFIRAAHRAAQARLDAVVPPRDGSYQASVKHNGTRGLHRSGDGVSRTGAGGEAMRMRNAGIRVQ